MGRPLLLLGCAIGIFVPHSLPASQIFEVFPPVSPVLEMDPSVRSTAMGSASGAVFWGADPNYWANPAFLGYMNGIRYDDAVVDWGTFSSGLPGDNFSFGIRETARRGAIGYGGLGVALAGQPFEGVGGVRNEIGSVSEEVRSWSAGISLAGLARTLLHRSPAIARHLDLALGYSHKTLENSFDQHDVLWDWGLLARAGADFVPGGLPARIEGAYAYSQLNQTNGGYGNDRQKRNCLGLHVSAGRMPEGFGSLPSWLRSGFEPLVSIGGAWDGVYRPGAYEDNLDRWGAELGLANLFFFRLGGTGELSSSGYGIGLPIGQFGGVRFDQADTDLDLKYRAWSLWIDPLAIARAGR